MEEISSRQTDSGEGLVVMCDQMPKEVAKAAAAVSKAQAELRGFDPSEEGRAILVASQDLLTATDAGGVFVQIGALPSFVGGYLETARGLFESVRVITAGCAEQLKVISPPQGFVEVQDLLVADIEKAMGTISGLLDVLRSGQYSGVEERQSDMQSLVEDIADEWDTMGKAFSHLMTAVFDAVEVDTSALEEVDRQQEELLKALNDL